MRLLLTIALVLLAACEPKSTTPEPRVDAGSATAVKVPAPPIDFEPIAARLALPVEVRALRLPEESVGVFRDQALETPARLRALGVNLCQTGWMIQGFIERDDGIAVTPVFPIPKAELPIGPTKILHPSIPDQSLLLDFKEASLTRVLGTVRVLTESGGDELMRMNIDAEPVGITTGPGLGAQGCFTTGYYQLQSGDDDRVGPVSAVYDGKRLHYVGLRLTEKYGIGVWLHLEPAHRQPQNVIRGDLATVGEKPKRFPFRVVFETRRTDGFLVTVDETPATEGALTASFLKANPQGPIRIELENLAFPAWDGPMSGATVEKLRVESMIVTDIDGVGVPVPSEPTFGQETAKRSGPPSASPRVSPEQTGQK